MLNDLQIQLCDIQGRLFELSGKKNIPSAAFVKTFMRSHVAKGLDSSYTRLQWMGEEYLLEEVKDAGKDKLKVPGEVYNNEVLYWMGYIYRYWHYYTGEESIKVLRQGPPQTMKRNYAMIHTFARELAIEDLKEIRKKSSSFFK